MITIGASGKDKNIIFPRDVLKDKGVAIIYTNRGGDITVHEPFVRSSFNASAVHEQAKNKHK